MLIKFKYFLNPLAISLVIILSSFIPLDNSRKIVLENQGVFSCVVNDKPYVIKGFTALMRTVTGGRKELSLSNDLFTSFFFINPSPKDYVISLTQRKEAVVKFTNPANLFLYIPDKGTIKLKVLDESAKTLSGEFEMELVSIEQPGKKIKITQGKLINIPIIYR